jgi:hypothetical protein
LALAAIVLCGAASADPRAEGRAAGGDRTTAVRVAHALLAQPLALQLTKVRCERTGAERFCGLTLSGVKFHRRVDAAAFWAEVDGLVRGAFAVDPAIGEVDLWVTVPADAGKGAVVSGDFALPTSLTVFATTVPRGQSPRWCGDANVFWDPAFKREIAQGSSG